MYTYIYIYIDLYIWLVLRWKWDRNACVTQWRTHNTHFEFIFIGIGHLQELTSVNISSCLTQAFFNYCLIHLCVSYTTHSSLMTVKLYTMPIIALKVHTLFFIVTYKTHTTKIYAGLIKQLLCIIKNGQHVCEMQIPTHTWISATTYYSTTRFELHAV